MVECMPGDFSRLDDPKLADGAPRMNRNLPEPDKSEGGLDIPGSVSDRAG
jgi:hypothetical protein